MHLSPAEYVIHIFGGVRATARALDRAPSSISKWQNSYKGIIPSQNIPKIMTKAKELNLDIRPEDLVIGRDMKLKEYSE